MKLNIRKEGTEGVQFFMPAAVLGTLLFLLQPVLCTATNFSLELQIKGLIFIPPEGRITYHPLAVICLEI